MQHMNHPIEEDLMRDTQYKRLVEKHDRLEAELQERQKGLSVDWDGVKLIKKDKLKVAEEMEAIRRTRH